MIAKRLWATRRRDVTLMALASPASAQTRQTEINQINPRKVEPANDEELTFSAEPVVETWVTLMTSNLPQLVCQHLENISREALERHAESSIPSLAHLFLVFDQENNGPL